MRYRFVINKKRVKILKFKSEVNKSEIFTTIIKEQIEKNNKK